MKPENEPSWRSLREAKELPGKTFREVHRAINAVFGFGESAIRSKARQYPVTRARHAFLLASCMAGRLEQDASEWLGRNCRSVEDAFTAAKNRYETEPDFRSDFAKAIKLLKG